MERKEHGLHALFAFPSDSLPRGGYLSGKHTLHKQYVCLHANAREQTRHDGEEKKKKSWQKRNLKPATPSWYLFPRKQSNISACSIIAIIVIIMIMQFRPCTHNDELINSQRKRQTYILTSIETIHFPVIYYYCKFFPSWLFAFWKQSPHNWTCPCSDIGGLILLAEIKEAGPQRGRPGVQKPPSPHHVLAPLLLHSRLWWSADWRKPVVFSLCVTASAPTQLPLRLWNSPHPVVLLSHSAAGFVIVAVFVRCQSPGAVFAFYGNVWIGSQAKYVCFQSHWSPNFCVSRHTRAGQSCRRASWRFCGHFLEFLVKCNSIQWYFFFSPLMSLRKC